jgi:hypothetical protein
MFMYVAYVVHSCVCVCVIEWAEVEVTPVSNENTVRSPDDDNIDR